MFRAVEAVYKANRSLLSVRNHLFISRVSVSNRNVCFQKLKEIGTSPSSPKALGDLLMRWVGGYMLSSQVPTEAVF